jgi:hypothetical protein
VQPDHQVYGVTYKWRDDGSDADLLTTAEVQELEVVDEEGATTVQRYLYPGPSDCLTCHAAGAGSVLGLRARQFAGMPGGDEAADALEWFAAAGYFDVGTEELARESIPAFAPLDDELAPLALRARSYLDVNCSHCHGGQALDRALWDARITVPLNHQNIVMGPVLGDHGGDDDRIVVPGDVERSVLHRRAATTEVGLRMPPLARSVEDESFVTVLEGWIQGMTATTLPPVVCGDSAAPWDEVTAGDALVVLRAAVSIDYCAACLCDVNSDDSIGASDALRVLRLAVGADSPLVCPAC